MTTDRTGHGDQEPGGQAPLPCSVLGPEPLKRQSVLEHSEFSVLNDLLEGKPVKPP